MKNRKKRLKIDFTERSIADLKIEEKRLALDVCGLADRIFQVYV